MIIEEENLEVLKLLSNSYREQVNILLQYVLVLKQVSLEELFVL
jgi:hypothetical protein